jgi:hypothetical protein
MTLIMVTAGQGLTPMMAPVAAAHRNSRPVHLPRPDFLNTGLGHQVGGALAACPWLTWLAPCSPGVTNLPSDLMLLVAHSS